MGPGSNPLRSDAYLGVTEVDVGEMRCQRGPVAAALTRSMACALRSRIFPLPPRNRSLPRRCSPNPLLWTPGEWRIKIEADSGWSSSGNRRIINARQQFEALWPRLRGGRRRILPHILHVRLRSALGSSAPGDSDGRCRRPARPRPATTGLWFLLGDHARSTVTFTLFISQIHRSGAEGNRRVVAGQHETKNLITDWELD
jgi:hypothetical protein